MNDSTAGKRTTPHTGNPHLAVPPVRVGAAAVDAAIAAVLVHGRGQDPTHMVDIAHRVGMADVHGVCLAAADNSWYPGRFTEPIEVNEPWLSHSLEAVESALSGLRSQGFPSGRTVLVGFSQGACLLAEHLVRRPLRYGAVALLTGGYIGPEGIVKRPGGALLDTPVLLSSSRVDGWVPPERVVETAGVLADMGAVVDLRIHENPEHGVSDDEVRAVRDLLHLARTGSPDHGA